jgi:hypothetical protein
MTQTSKTYTVIAQTNGHKNAYDCTTKPAAVAVFHELAVQGITAHVYSPKGNVLDGYLAEQGPVQVIDGQLRTA